jgi:adenylate cyclase class 2
MAAYTETETKLYCPDLSAIARKLLLAGAKLVTPRVFERNVRYENADESLTENGIVMRLRQDYRARLTYKGPAQIAEGIMQRYEAEVEVSDFDAMHAILLGLGYHPHMIYEKYRTTYELDETEIVLDEMPYGNFVEIEGEAAAIERVIQTLGVSEAKRYGNSYAGLFEIVKHNLGLSFRDLTFEQFEGIDVPESAFRPSPPAPLPQGEG